jgi:hypothetical protein
VRTCLACGHEGHDVTMSLVEYSDPLPVEVAIPVSHDGRGRVIGNEVRTVPGRYGAEWRCTDGVACAERLASLPPAAAEVASFFAGVEP